MNRTTLVVLVVAAVVGVSGGSLVALGRPETGRSGGPPTTSPATTVPASATPSSTAGPTRSPSPTPTVAPSGSPAVLLYADRRTIHDGATAVPYDWPDDSPFPVPDRLVRTRSGYLVTRPTSMEDGAHLLVYAVSRSGETTKVAEVANGFDLDPDGTRVVGTDARSGRLQVWDLTGKVLAKVARPVPKGVWLDAVWAGEVVVLTGRAVRDTAPVWPIWRWDPDGGSVKKGDDAGLVGMQGSADGKLLLGYVGIEGYPADEGNLCIRVIPAPGAPRVGWQTCDYRFNAPYAAVSPGGTRVLAVPGDSDGFGPGEFLTFSATRGPRAGLRRITTPALTVDGQWLDDEHLVLRSRTDDRLDKNTGTILRRCDLAGTCTVVARQDKGDLVTGEQY